MFGLRTKQIRGSDPTPEVLRAAPNARAVIPFPTSQVPARPVVKEMLRSYNEVADSLGFKPAPLVRVQLMLFFEQEGMKIYDYEQVSAWLTEKKKQAGTTAWCWRALRKKDIITDYEWGHDRQNMLWIDGFYSSVKSGCRPYDRLVPLHALKKVKQIEAKFGDCVKFFVSDYDSPRVDPFIMVRPTRMNPNDGDNYMFVFDVWDEPGFGV